MARDCYDLRVAQELESLSFELVEKAENLEGLYTLKHHSADTEDPDISTEGDRER